MSFAKFCEGKTMKDLARIAERAPQTVAAYRDGGPIPSDVLIKFADHYKCSIDRILGHHVPVTEANKEDFPKHPPQMFTVTAEQQALQQQLREAKFNNEILNKNLNATRDQLSSVQASLEKTQKGTSELFKENEMLKAKQAQVNTSTVSVTHAQGMYNDKAIEAEYTNRLKRLRGLLQSIHFLSEEK